MNNARALVGCDVELLGLADYELGSERRWLGYLSKLAGAPDKGSRMEFGDGYWAHRDGVALEFGFEPTTQLGIFMHRLERGRSLASHNVVGTLDLNAYDNFSIEPIADRPWAQKYLDMGCAPDYLVRPDNRVIKRNVPPGIKAQPVRECSGHVHMSLPDYIIESEELKAQFIAEIDSVVYPLLAPLTHPDLRQWYRRRRVFRPTPYGVEYRTIGAGQLFADSAETVMSMIFSMVQSVWEV